MMTNKINLLNALNAYKENNEQFNKIQQNKLGEDEINEEVINTQINKMA